MDGILNCHVFCENPNYHIQCQRFDTDGSFSNFHPKSLQIKIPSMSDKILSVDKIFICQNHPWMKKSCPWRKV